jgi:MYXO-CTERM domain-containing protein
VLVGEFNGVKQLGAVSLIDGSIEQSSMSSAAVANPDGINVLVQNVYVTTPAPLVASGNAPAVMGSGTTDLIAEYAYTDTAITGASYAPNTSYDVIDGVVGQSGLTNIKLGAGPASTDLVLRHLPGPLPWFTDPGVIDVTTMGADPTGNVDSTAAIQNAIDASASTGNEVFLPRGVYLVSGTLTLKPDSRLFGVPGSKSTLFASQWNPMGNFVPFIQTADTPSGKTFVGDIQIILPDDDADGIGYAQSYLSALDWRAGRSSVLYHAVVQLNADWSESQPSSAARKIISVENNGGGRWYGLQETASWDNARDNSPDFRFLYVDHTTEPLSLYGPNLEHAESDDFVEISGASNVRVLETKTECRSTWVAIESSSNIQIAGIGGDWTPENPNVGVLVEGSTDIEAALLGWYGNEASASSTYVTASGGGYPSASVSYVDGVSLFQVGSFDESAFPHCGDGVCDGAETALNCPKDCAPVTLSDAGADGNSGRTGKSDSGVPPGPPGPGVVGAQPSATSSSGCACRAAEPNRGDTSFEWFAAVGALVFVARGRRRS